ncbi:hypothetical protein H0H93_005558 [Arthromyces matolae]|nr:hypothetical protein H0H93_005558 [Arthromyces matolae]
MLPPDILEQIFLLAAVAHTHVDIPPILSQLPWVLGRVCSLWRRVSQSMPILWRTEIVYFGSKDDLEFDDRFLPEILESRKYYSMKALECATELLPPVAYLRLWASIYCHPLALSPFLPFVSELRWDVISDPSQDLLLDKLSPCSLSQLRDLTITLPLSDASTRSTLLNPDLFGDTPRLQHLSLSSTTPLFTFHHHAWKNLDSLDIETGRDSISPEIISVWRDCFSLNDLSSLRSLTITSTTELMVSLLDLQFLWHQLAALKLNWYGLPLNFKSHPITNLLPRLTSLVTLALADRKKWGHKTEVLDNSPLLQFSVSPSLFGDVIHSSKLWGAFSSIHLDLNISLPQLRTILLYCDHLISLTVYIVPNSMPHPQFDDIILSHLTHLDISLESDRMSSTSIHLFAPNLKRLKIHVSEVAVLVREATDLVVHSGASLSEFACSAREPFYLDEASRSGDVRELLSCLSLASSVDLRDVIIPKHVLNAIAEQSLLPHVQSLSFCAEDLEDIRSAITRRLCVEEETGGIDLREVTFYHVRNVGEHESDFDNGVLDEGLMSALEKYRPYVDFKTKSIPASLWW